MSEQELAVEAAQSKLAAYAALGAAAAILIAVGLYVMAVRGADATSKASLLATTHEHSTQLILSGLFRTLSFALLAIVLGFFAVAAKRRMTILPGLTVPIAYAGPALFAISAPIATIAQVSAAKDFVNGAVHSDKAAEAVLGGSFPTVAQYLLIFATMLLAVSWIVIGMYCMRCGLLTRLSGSIALLIGVLTVVSAGSGFSGLALLIEFFWLASIAVMLLATPETKPPAWNLGVSVTWREVDAAKREAAAGPPDPEQ